MYDQGTQIDINQHLTGLTPQESSKGLDRHDLNWAQDRGSE